MFATMHLEKSVPATEKTYLQSNGESFTLVAALDLYYDNQYDELAYWYEGPGITVFGLENEPRRFQAKDMGHMDIAEHLEFHHQTETSFMECFSEWFNRFLLGPLVWRYDGNGI